MCFFLSLSRQFPKYSRQTILITVYFNSLTLNGNILKLKNIFCPRKGLASYTKNTFSFLKVGNFENFASYFT